MAVFSGTRPRYSDPTQWPYSLYPVSPSYPSFLIGFYTGRKFRSLSLHADIHLAHSALLEYRSRWPEFKFAIRPVLF